MERKTKRKCEQDCRSKRGGGGGEEDAGEGEVQADEPSPRSAGRIPEKYSLSDHGGGTLFFFSSLTFLALCTARCYC